MVDRILKAILLLSPIIYGTGAEAAGVNIRFFIFGSMALFIASLFDKPRRDVDMTYPAASLFGIALISLFWHNFNPIITGAILNLFLTLTTLVVIVRYADTPRAYYKYIVAAASINIFVFILQRIGYDPIYSSLPVGQEGGLMGNAPNLITYLTIVLFFLVKRSSMFLWLCILISFITKEYMLIATVLGIKFIFGNRANRIIALAILAVAITIAHKDIMQSLSIRWKIWSQAIDLICARPMLGYGFGMFGEASKQLINTGQYQVDALFNSYLQFIFNAGLLGAAWLVYVFREFKHRLMSSYHGPAVLAILLMALMEYPFEIVRLWFTIIAVIGFFLIDTEKEVA